MYTPLTIQINQTCLVFIFYKTHYFKLVVL